MVRLHGTIGLMRDPALHARLHVLEHAGAVETVVLEAAELGRRRLRLTGDKGTDCAISFDRAEDAQDGAVLLLEADRAIVLRVGTAPQWRLQPRDAAAALQLGWHVGNLHWRVRFEGTVLVVLLDGPLADYRARLREMLADRLVEEAGGD